MTIVGNLSLIQIIQGSDRIQDGLLRFEEDLVNVQEVFGTALDALTDKLEALENRHYLLPRSG